MDYTYNTWLNKPCFVKVLRFCEELLAVSCQLTLQACDSLKFNMLFHSKIVQTITLTHIWVTIIIILIEVSREFPPSLLKNTGPVWQLVRFLPRPFQFSIIYHFVLQQSETDSVSSSTIPSIPPPYLHTCTHINTKRWVADLKSSLFCLYSTRSESLKPF